MINYEIAIIKLIPWIREHINISPDKTIRIKVEDIKRELGPEFEKISDTELYWGLNDVLYRCGIDLKRGHTKYKEPVLVMKSFKEVTLPQEINKLKVEPKISEEDKKVVEEFMKFSKKLFLTFPAYQFFVKYLDLLNAGELPEQSPYPKNLLDFVKDMHLKMSRAINQDINKELRLIEIEEDLMPLLESTDNKIFYRPLFFPTVFINNEFIFETFIIKGILVVDVPNMEDLLIYTITMDVETNIIIVGVSSILEKLNVTSSVLDLTKDINKLYEYVRILVCNIVDMVEGNDEDIEITTIHTTAEQNAKRIKRGKIPFPTKVFIRANKEFKQYVKDFNDADEECKETKYTCKFLVRGHWMHFRAERYVRKKGEKTWVKPFYKGQGIVVAKPYKLIK